MPTLWRFTSLVVVALLAGCAPLAKPTSRVQGPACAPGISTVRVQGTVRDTGGAPIAGVRVFVVGTSCVAVTDSIGRYALPRAPTGRIHVRTEAAGWAPYEVTVGAYVEDGPVTFLDLVLSPRRMELNY